MLPPRLPQKAKRASRWRSQAHCNHVRKHACSKCLGTSGIEVAHLRRGSGAGMGQKPDDFRTLSLCSSCHREQHTVGEDTFWKGQDPESIVQAFNFTSPKRHEIQAILRERGDSLTSARAASR